MIYYINEIWREEMDIFENKKKDSHQPVFFAKPGEEWKYDPVHFMEKEVNGVTKFAILKTTDGGKHLRGNMLYYCLDGVEIYTESTNVIFVDTINKTMFIKDYEKVIKEIAPEDPEERQYVMLYTDLGYDESGGDNNEFPLRWEAVQGRTNAYENIKINAAVIDIDKSLVLVETVAFKDSMTVRQFVNYMKNGGFIEDESFDINDYSGTEYF